jgi:hypothetical protein
VRAFSSCFYDSRAFEDENEKSFIGIDTCNDHKSELSEREGQ